MSGWARFLGARRGLENSSDYFPEISCITGESCYTYVMRSRRARPGGQEMTQVHTIEYANWAQRKIDTLPGFYVIAGYNNELLLDEAGRTVAVRPYTKTAATMTTHNHRTVGSYVREVHNEMFQQIATHIGSRNLTKIGAYVGACDGEMYDNVIRMNRDITQ